MVVAAAVGEAAGHGPGHRPGHPSAARRPRGSAAITRRRAPRPLLKGRACTKPGSARTGPPARQSLAALQCGPHRCQSPAALQRPRPPISGGRRGPEAGASGPGEGPGGAVLPGSLRRGRGLCRPERSCLWAPRSSG